MSKLEGTIAVNPIERISAIEETGMGAVQGQTSFNSRLRAAEMAVLGVERSGTPAERCVKCIIECCIYCSHVHHFMIHPA